MTASSNADGGAFAGLRDEFFAEAEEHLQTMQRVLLAAEARAGGGIDTEEIEELFRSFHTLKGMSAMMELEPAEQLCHEAEGYLRSIRGGSAKLGEAGVDQLLTSVRLLEEIVTAFRTHAAPPSIAAAVQGLAALPERDGPDHVPRDSEPQSKQDSAGVNWLVTYTPSVALAQRGIDVNEIRQRLAALGTIRKATPQVFGGGAVTFQFLVSTRHPEAGSVLDGWRHDGVAYAPAEPADTPSPTITPTPSLAAQPGAGTVARTQLVRVDLGRLDELMRTVGDLVVCRARLDRQLRDVESALPVHARRAIAETTQVLARQLRELRNSVMRVRLVPVRDVFERMRLVVRDLARTSGRRVVLHLDGVETEIDKYVVERLMDPLLHLVRNAVGHGLETAEERVAGGKAPDGTLRLVARTQGDAAIISVEDDGRGIDRERVLGRARQLGIPTAAHRFGDEYLLDVLCTPGLSTRDVADRVSGRGIGLSAARTAVEDLGGALRLRTQRGRGSTFIITMPLTLAITDAILIGVGEQRFAVPRAMVREVVEVAEAEITRSPGAEMILHRARAVPLIRLSSLFGIKPLPSRSRRLLLVGDEGGATGIGVDRVLGVQEVVVRTLRDPLVAIPGIAGATELGDGCAVLILDAMEIAAMARGSARRREAATGFAQHTMH